jgi:hypothetical protein
VRVVLLVLVLAVMLVLVTAIPAEMADRMRPTLLLTYAGPFEHPGRSRVLELDLGRNPTQPLIPPPIPGTPPLPAPETEQRVYLILLAVLVVLLALPSGLRRLYRSYGGT